MDGIHTHGLHCWQKHGSHNDDGGYRVEEASYDEQNNVDQEEHHVSVVGNAGKEGGDGLRNLFEGHEGGEYCGSTQQEGCDTVEDRGGAINGNHIDIFFNTHSEALQFGTKYADVYLYDGTNGTINNNNVPANSGGNNSSGDNSGTSDNNNSGTSDNNDSDNNDSGDSGESGSSDSSGDNNSNDSTDSSK